MADETITRKVSERYTRAPTTGEHMGPCDRMIGETVAGETVACGLGGSCF